MHLQRYWKSNLHINFPLTTTYHYPLHSFPHLLTQRSKKKKKKIKGPHESLSSASLSLLHTHVTLIPHTPLTLPHSYNLSLAWHVSLSVFSTLFTRNSIFFLPNLSKLILNPNLRHHTHTQSLPSVNPSHFHFFTLFHSDQTPSIAGEIIRCRTSPTIIWHLNSTIHLHSSTFPLHNHTAPSANPSILRSPHITPSPLLTISSDLAASLRPHNTSLSSINNRCLSPPSSTPTPCFVNDRRPPNHRCHANDHLPHDPFAAPPVPPVTTSPLSTVTPWNRSCEPPPSANRRQTNIPATPFTQRRSTAVTRSPTTTITPTSWFCGFEHLISYKFISIL